MFRRFFPLCPIRLALSELNVSTNQFQFQSIPSPYCFLQFHMIFDWILHFNSLVNTTFDHNILIPCSSLSPRGALCQIWLNPCRHSWDWRERTGRKESDEGAEAKDTNAALHPLVVASQGSTIIIEVSDVTQVRPALFGCSAHLLLFVFCPLGCSFTQVARSACLWALSQTLVCAIKEGDYWYATGACVRSELFIL